MTTVQLTECELVIGSKNILELKGHHDTLVVPTVYPTTSVPRLSLFTARGVAVPEVQDMVMAYVAGTSGEDTAYRVQLVETIPLTEQRYVGKIVADGRVYTITCPAVHRS